MEFIDVTLFCKAKSIVTSLYEMMFCSSIFPSPMMQFPTKEWRPTHPAGLKALLLFSQGPQSPTTHQYPCHVIHSFMIPPQSPSSTTSPRPLLRSLTNSRSYSSSSSALDDWIGTESGVYMNSSNIEEDGTEKMEKLPEEGERKQSCYARRKEYPPPIPLLARTGNLPGHMPWILTRHYIDGKLILTEERVKHHEYFEAYRENGRLILNLVSLDNTINISCSHSSNPKNERDQEIEDLDFTEDENETQAGSTDQEEEEEEVAEDQEIHEYHGDDWEEYLEVNEKLATATTWASVPKPSLKNGSREKGRGDLHRCSTYAGKMTSDSSNLPCNDNSHRNAANTANACIHRSGLTSLAFGIIRRPMTTVV